MTADVITFPRNPGAPVQPLPRRRHFGLRKPGQAVSDFLNATLDRLPVCPTLEAELAAEIGVVAKLCDVLVNSAQTCRNTHAAAALRTIQGELETLAAEVTP